MRLRISGFCRDRWRRARCGMRAWSLRCRWNRSVPARPDSACRFLPLAPIPVRAACRRSFLHATFVRRPSRRRGGNGLPSARRNTSCGRCIRCRRGRGCGCPFRPSQRADRARSGDSCWRLLAGCVPARACALPPTLACAFRRWRFLSVVRRAFAYSLVGRPFFGYPGRSIPCGQCVRLAINNSWNCYPRFYQTYESAALASRAGKALDSPERLKNQLQGKLEQTRVANLLRLAKSGVSRTAIYAEELCVIEDIEYLRPKFQTRLFPNRGVLERPMSQLLIGGLQQSVRGELPNVPSALSAKIVGSKTKPSLRGLWVMNLPVISGLPGHSKPSVLPSNSASSQLLIKMGNPLW